MRPGIDDVDRFKLVIGSIPPQWFFEAMERQEITPMPPPGANDRTWGSDGAMVRTSHGWLHASIGDMVLRDNDGSLHVLVAVSAEETR